jgi:hypothetical protein
MRPGNELVEGDQAHAKPRTAEQAPVTGETPPSSDSIRSTQLRATLRTGEIFAAFSLREVSKRAERMIQ